jgi:hypothetical protein
LEQDGDRDDGVSVIAAVRKLSGRRTNRKADLFRAVVMRINAAIRFFCFDSCAGPRCPVCEADALLPVETPADSPLPVGVFARNRMTGLGAYLMAMSPFKFCIPTVGTKVPAGPDWLHEIKYDVYRLRVERNGDRVV